MSHVVAVWLGCGSLAQGQVIEAGPFPLFCFIVLVLLFIAFGSWYISKQKGTKTRFS
jgi:hypothetical protein